MMETTDAKKDFLKLLTVYFAAPVLIAVYSLIVSECMPPFTIKIGGHEQSLTRHIFLWAVPTCIYIIIYIKFWAFGNLCHTWKYKTGILLLIIGKIYSPIPQLLHLFGTISPTGLSLIHAGAFVVHIIGLYMFIGGSIADKKLKRFVKWTPFISILVEMYLVACGSFNSQLSYFVSIGTHSLIFLIIYRMAKNRCRISE